MDPFVAYHNVDGAEHQRRVNELAPQGFRPVALNVSGDPDAARYAALWVQRPGPEWVAVHGLSADQYEQRFDEITARGLAPVLVTATGPADAATFAALFERDIDGPWFARHNLRWDPVNDPGTLAHENQRAFDEHFIPRCLAVYGAPGNLRFAGVWHHNPGLPWSWWWTARDSYQRFFEAEVRAGTRPSFVSPAPDGRILSVFRDEPIGDWWARHNLTAADYQGEFDTRVAAGMWPLVVQASGSGSDARYASLFVRDDRPIARQWNVTGPAFAGADDVDATVRTIMQSFAMRAGSVAIARNGTISANHGYTWAEPGYATTQPASLFRIASVSKLFTAAAIDRLVATGVIAWNAPAFGFLGITSKLLPSQTPDALVGTITVLQLATLMSGLQRDFGADLRSIAARLGRTTTPTRDDLVRYLYGESLDHAPGTGDPLYSNSAFTVLTSIIERASGRSITSYLQSALLAPLGINDLFVAATGAGARRPGEISGYDHPGVKDSQLNVAPGAVEANAYGGDFVLEVGEGAGGFVTSTATIARFIGTHAVWDVGPRAPAVRHGTLDGTCSGAISRRDGIDFAYAFNRRVTDTEHDGITAAIDAVIDRHAATL